jgi:arylsulfatase A-like enzyme
MDTGQGEAKGKRFLSHIVQGSLIGGFCWLIFSMAEIIFRSLESMPVAPFIPVLALIVSATIGLLIGAVLGGLLNVVASSAGARLRDISMQPLLMASSLATVILVYGVREAKPLLTASPSAVLMSLGAGGVLLFPTVVLAAAYQVLRRIKGLFPCFASFGALACSLDLVLVGGFYCSKHFLPGQFFFTTFRSAVFNVAILLSGVLLYFVLRSALSFLFGLRPFITRKGILWTAAGLCLVLAGVYVQSMFYWSGEEFVSRHGKKPNVILITLDTARADHLSCYGYQRKTTPFIDSFAEDSMLFKNAYSTSSWTFPAHASIFTGMYPSKHGGGEDPAYSQYLFKKYGRELKGVEKEPDLEQKAMKLLADKNVTLAEILSAQGYKTCGIIGGPACSSFTGLGQGFDFYDNTIYNPFYEKNYFTVFRIRIIRRFFSLVDIMARYGIAKPGKTAPQVNAVAFDWLDKHYKHPFFLFCNFYDVHYPYYPPTPYDKLFAGGDTDAVKHFACRAMNASFIDGQRQIIDAVLSRKHTLSHAERDILISQYDGEFRYLDYHIHKLLQKLKDLKVYDNTMIIITSDHGESFGEHNYMEHSFCLYEDAIKIPLLIKYPLARVRGVSEKPASLVDIFPSILSVLSLPIPAGVQGDILPDVRHPIISESNIYWKYVLQYGPYLNKNLKTISDGTFKYIWESNGNSELYNIKQDPLELNNLISRLPAQAQAMQVLLDDWSASFKPVVAAKPYEIDNAAKETLRDLGYLQ